MSGLESPWQCPHGRPTMKHLVDFDKILIEEQLPPKKKMKKPVFLDPFQILPFPLIFKILIALDARTLAKAAQVSKMWNDCIENKFMDYG